MNVIESGQSLNPDDGTIHGVAFSVDGKMLAACGDRFVSIFETKTIRRRHRLAGHSDEVRGVAFSPDGKLLASASMDKTIRIWEPGSGELLKVIQNFDSPITHTGIRSITFSPDSKTIASCGTTNDITFWNVDSGVWDRISWTNHTQEGGCFSLAISPNGKHCAIAGGRAPNFFGHVSHYELCHGLKLLWHRAPDGDEPMTHVAFSPAGDQVVACGQDNQIHIWDGASGSELHVLKGSPQDQPVVVALFTRKGDALISVTRNERLQFWEIGAPEPRGEATGKAHDVRSMALSPSGRTAATAADREVHFWKIRELELASK